MCIYMCVCMYRCIYTVYTSVMCVHVRMCMYVCVPQFTVLTISPSPPLPLSHTVHFTQYTIAVYSAHYPSLIPLHAMQQETASHTTNTAIETRYTNAICILLLLTPYSTCNPNLHPHLNPDAIYEYSDLNPNANTLIS
jgi:hypothetical protein